MCSTIAVFSPLLSLSSSSTSLSSSPPLSLSLFLLSLSLYLSLNIDHPDLTVIALKSVKAMLFSVSALSMTNHRSVRFKTLSAVLFVCGWPVYFSLYDSTVWNNIVTLTGGEQKHSGRSSRKNRN